MELKSKLVWFLGNYADDGRKENIRKENMFSTNQKDSGHQKQKCEMTTSKATATEKLVGKVLIELFRI